MTKIRNFDRDIIVRFMQENCLLDQTPNQKVLWFKSWLQ